VPRNSAEEAFEAIATSVMSAAGVTAGTMFGARALKVREKVFAMVVKGELVVKLPTERVERLVSLGSGRRFDPGHGRLMKEWVAIPLGLKASWSRLVGEAKDFVNHGDERERSGVGAARRAVPAKKRMGRSPPRSVRKP
jgi:hypothetical protein